MQDDAGRKGESLEKRIGFVWVRDARMDLLDCVQWTLVRRLQGVEAHYSSKHKQNQTRNGQILSIKQKKNKKNTGHFVRRYRPV
jgi:hypothetical protein